MIITFTNVIGAIQSLVKRVVTDNLKMWLGFETSEHLGLEQVINGDFSTDSDWNLGTGWDIDEANNKATHTGTGGTIKQALSNLIVGKDYVASVTLNSIGDTSLSNTSFQIRNNADTASVAQLLSSNGDILANRINYLTLNFTATEVNNIIRVFSEDDIFVTDFSIKQLTQITPDKSGNNNVGELFTGKALEFDGTGDNVDIDFTTPIKSAVFWVKPLDTGLENILWFGGAFAGTKSIRSNGNVIQTSGLSSVSVYVDGVQTTSVPLNEWSRVVVNFASVTPSELKFGYAFNSYGYIQLSDVQLYNENLTTDDIAYDYANPNKLAIDNPSTSLVVTNLKGYWALSEGDGLVAYDSGTNLEEEEVTNGDFATDSDWIKENGWSIANGLATRTNVGSYTALQQNVLESGKMYQVTFTIDSVTSGEIFGIRLGNNYILSNKSTEETFTGVGVANATTLSIMGNPTFAGSISNISVREVTASDHGGILNGATYVDAQPRIPQLGMMNWSKGSNLLTYSEDFSQWTKNSGGTGIDPVLTANQTDPNNTSRATKIVFNKGTGGSTADLSVIQLSFSSQSNTASIYVRSDSAQRIMIRNSSNWQIYDITNTWVRIQKTDSGGSIQIGLREGYGVSNVPNISTIYVYGSQVESGSSASAYRLTDGGATLNSTVIPNPTIPTKDIFGNLVRNRLNSFNLDGSGYAEVADDTDLDFGTGDFTLECWVKFDFLNQSSGWNVIVSNGSISSSGGSGFSLASSTSNFSIRLNAGTAVTKTFGTDNMTVGNWYHLVVTREGTLLKTYRDTSLKSSSTIISVDIDTSFPVKIGRDTLTSRFYKNLISDVRLYKGKALSATEIENNYNAGLSAHTND